MKVEKPWGHEIIWAHCDKYVGKILHIKAGHKLSLQFHNVKEETIRVLSGLMEFLYEENATQHTLKMGPGDTFHIKPKTVHRMIALEDCDVVEVSTPELTDVVRLKDEYGR